MNNDMFCRPNIVLPSIYSDALSFYETVCLIAQRVEEVKDLVDQYEQNYKDYTDGKIEALDSKITQQLDQTVNQLRSDYSDFERNVNNNLILFDNRLNNLNSKIDDSIVGVSERIDLAIEQNNDYLFTELSKGLVGLKVINFFTGETVTVQEMFNYLASFHLSEGISYIGLANKAITYNALIALNIDYTRLVTSGGIVI